ncbi:prepilin-type N-terminal cleavage/methylation domain-containing protein [Phormidium tenue FACHB-886]|nr:prepilin-type N-terminal cleavage/methylation domain-containing protein [Phormidium tenue FACHB-886]
MPKFPLKHSTAGYTLVELLVVVVIVGILATIAAPGWLAFMNSRRATAARDQILQSLRQAQAQAMQRKQVEAVQFNTTAALPTLTAVGITQTMGQGQLDPNAMALRARNGTTAIERLEFNSNGTLKSPVLEEGGVKITVTVPANTGAKRCVIIQTLLGAIRSGSDAECD